MSHNTNGKTIEGAPLPLLRVEGAALAVAAVAGYAHFGPSWWLFAVLLLVPDLSVLGYLAGPRVGALVYNAAHTTLGPLALFSWGRLPTGRCGGRGARLARAHRAGPRAGLRAEVRAHASRRDRAPLT